MKKKYIVLFVVAAMACFFLWQMNGDLSVSGVEKGANVEPVVAVESLPADTEPLAAVNVVESIQSAAEIDQPAEEFTTLKGAESLPQSEQQSLWTAFSEARRAIRPLTDHQKTMPGNESALYLASNPGQKIRARFLDDGVRLLSGYAGRDWEAVMSLDTEGDVLEVRQQGTQIEYVRDGIVEWYHNKPEGLEHGYIVERPTTEYTEYTEGQLRIPVQINGLNVQTLEDGALQFINDAGEPVLSYNKLQVWDANGTVLASTMAPTANGLDDMNAAYPIMIDPLIGAFGDDFNDGICARRSS